jgi:hypothetical protein
MKLYSYVIINDSGFAPDPSDNYCTLACCKPKIRKNADVGDWVVGTGSKSTVGNDKLVYAMKITEKMDFDRYFKDNRFKDRLDNIYYLENGSWKQKENNFHYESDIKHDLSGLYVLVSSKYHYFGKNAVKIPAEFRGIIKKGPGHKSNFNNELIASFIDWLEKNYGNGMHSKPYDFKGDKCRIKGCK